MNYRRVTDLDEDNDDLLTTNWTKAASLTAPQKRDHECGTEMPTESDVLDGTGTEEVCEFKRVQIVTPSATTLITSASELAPESNWSDHGFPVASLSDLVRDSDYSSRIDAHREEIEPVSDQNPNSISGQDERMRPMSPGKFRKRGTFVRHVMDQHQGFYMRKLSGPMQLPLERRRNLPKGR